MGVGFFIFFSPVFFAGVRLCCLLFEPIIIKECCVQGNNKRVLIWMHSACLLFVPWRTFTGTFSYVSFHIKRASPLTASCLHPSVFHSCLMAPALRLCPTANASPPSSALTRRPPFTTPPGCSSSRSGNGPASPPSSRRLKSSPQSVPFNISHLSPFTCLTWFVSLSPCPHFGPLTVYWTWKKLPRAENMHSFSWPARGETTV